jgi:hypothetical protein
MEFALELSESWHFCTTYGAIYKYLLTKQLIHTLPHGKWLENNLQKLIKWLKFGRR